MAERFRPYRFYSEREAKAIRRKRRAILSLIVAVIAVVAAGYGYLRYTSHFEKTREARLATQSKPLVAKVGGKVVKIFVNETESAKAGDPIVQVDPQEFEAALSERRQEFEKSEDRIKGGKVHLDRLEKAAAAGGDAERKKFQDARAWYARTQRKHEELRQAVNEAEAKVKATIVTAPANGHVAQKLVDVGAVVAEGQPVVHFVEPGTPWLVANFKEQQLDEIKVGQKAEIKVPALGKTFVGTVESIPKEAVPTEHKSELVERVEVFLKKGNMVPIRIALDPNSIRNDVNRMVNGSPAEVTVYVK